MIAIAFDRFQMGLCANKPILLVSDMLISEVYFTQRLKGNM